MEGHETEKNPNLKFNFNPFLAFEFWVFLVSFFSGLAASLLCRDNSFFCNIIQTLPYKY